MAQHTQVGPRIAWNGKGELLFGRVMVGGVSRNPPYPGASGPWFGWVGQGYPHPFEDWFDSEAEAKAAVEPAALRLMFEGDR
jgi:hypothetical protein